MTQPTPLPETITQIQRDEQATAVARHQQLQTSWAVHEQPLISQTPLIGPLLTRFRQFWLNIAARWYLQALTQQQNEFNALVVQQLNHHQHQLDNHQDRLDYASDWLLTQSRTHHDHSHDLAQINLQLRHLHQRLDTLETLLDPPQQ